MSDFGHFRQVFARKPHICEHCQSEISKGEKHLSVAGRFDGDFQAYRIHLECQEAAADYSRAADLRHDDEHPWLYQLGDDEREDRLWLREKHPIIAARIDAKYPLVSA